MKANWIVVIRKVRGHETERGVIARTNLTEEQARIEAKHMARKESLRKYNVWALPESSY